MTSLAASPKTAVSKRSGADELGADRVRNGMFSLNKSLISVLFEHQGNAFSENFVVY